MKESKLNKYVNRIAKHIKKETGFSVTVIKKDETEFRFECFAKNHFVGHTIIDKYQSSGWSIGGSNSGVFMLHDLSKHLNLEWQVIEHEMNEQDEKGK